MIILAVICIVCMVICLLALLDIKRRISIATQSFISMGKGVVEMYDEMKKWPNRL